MAGISIHQISFLFNAHPMQRIFDDIRATLLYSFSRCTFMFVVSFSMLMVNCFACCYGKKFGKNAVVM